MRVIQTEQVFPRGERKSLEEPNMVSPFYLSERYGSSKITSGL